MTASLCTGCTANTSPAAPAASSDPPIRRTSANSRTLTAACRAMLTIVYPAGVSPPIA